MRILTITLHLNAIIRPLEVSDLAAAVTLDQQIFSGWWSWQNYQAELQRSSSTLLGLWLSPAEEMLDTVVGPTTVSPSQLIGISCLWRVLDEAHITLLGIHPRYQGRGLGQALLVSLLTLARLKQSHQATLEVSTINTSAITLYQKLGFKTAGRRPNYYDNGEDALILWQGNLQSPQLMRSLQEWQQETAHRLATWGCQELKINDLN